MFDIMALFKESGSIANLQENREEDVWDDLYYLHTLEHDDKTVDYQNYLSRGDKVNTLVKEKRRRELVSFSGNNFLKLFSSTSIESRENFVSSLFEYVSEVVAKKVVKPVFHELAQKIKCKNSEGQDYEPLLKLFGKVAPQISNELDFTSGKLLKYFLKMNSNEIPAVMLYAKDREPAALALEGDIGKRRRDNSYCIRGSRSVYRYVTDYRGISRSALLVELDKLFQERISELSQEERMQDVVYRSMYEAVMSRLSKHVSNSGLVVSSEKLEKYPDLFGYLESTGMKILSLPKLVDEKQCKELFGVYPLDECDIAYCAPFLDTLPRSQYVESNCEYIWNLHDAYMLLFKLIYGEWKQTEQTRKYMRELNGSAARVFETKRNIPDKYLKAMCESDFNEYFGYVEIDAECDLASIDQIQKEFLVMKEKCFGKQKFEDVSLRFRKLGRHKALGLYFPLKKCLCVDIRCPSSMGHEYLHMVDFENGELSAKYDFLKVRECYKRALNGYINKLPADDALRVRLKGTSKYNLDYYLEPTEIFARCGELFFTKLKGVDNSLLKPKYDFSYPSDNEELMSLIDDYYSVIFGVLDLK